MGLGASRTAALPEGEASILARSVQGTTIDLPRAGARGGQVRVNFAHSTAAAEFPTRITGIRSAIGRERPDSPSFSR